MKVNFKKLDKNAHAPTYGSLSAAGADIYALTNGETVSIAPDETVMIHTGFAVEIPEGYAGLIYARSGIATKRGLALSLAFFCQTDMGSPVERQTSSARITRLTFFGSVEAAQTGSSAASRA